MLVQVARRVGQGRPSYTEQEKTETKEWRRETDRANSLAGKVQELKKIGTLVTAFCTDDCV